jgi:RNA polymerase sigma-70 factor (ECF subfamily)
VRETLAALAAGDMGALDELYDELAVRIFNYARTIVQGREVAEDVTHDVFLRMHHMAARLAGMANPAAYIMVMARNLAYDHLRRAKRNDGEEVAERAISPAPYSVLPDAMSGLPAAQRETVYLHHICGFTQREVARIMQVPLVTVKWRCGRAKKHLQEYFNPKEVFKHETV